MKPLIVFELANNHQGSLEHAQKIVAGLATLKCEHAISFDFAVKFQFRDFDTFIDPKADVDSNKHIRRFRTTRLKESEWVEITESVRSNGFSLIATTFDEASVDKAVQLGITNLKIASCSAQEWPLIQKAAAAAEYIIVSTAGLRLDQVDSLYSFLAHESRGSFALLHCAGIYPAPLDSLNLNTIRRFIRRYPKAHIGYSGHEAPAAHSIAATALAMGAEIFERHVGLSTQATPLNAYSLDLADVAEWLKVMSETLQVLGTEKSANYYNSAEHASLAELRRGVFARVDLAPNSEVSPDVVSFRFPLRAQQIEVPEFATIYHRFMAKRAIRAGEPLDRENTSVIVDVRSQNLDQFVHRVRGIASEASIDIPDDELIEVTHHFGIEEIWRYGCCIVNVLNRSYCKKLIFMTEGQQHPEHFHKIKDETFRVLWGKVHFVLDGIAYELQRGQALPVEPNVKHQFHALTDVVIEELSTNSLPENSYYTDFRISSRPRTSRKTITRNFTRSD